MAAVGATVLLLAACSPGGKAFDSIKGGNETADRVRSYDSWDELLKKVDEGTPEVDPIRAVVGDVTSVEQGRSFLWDISSEGKEHRVETEFGNPDAMITTYHVTVQVSSVVGAASDDGDLSFPLLDSGDPVQPPDGVAVEDLKPAT